MEADTNFMIGSGTEDDEEQKSGAVTIEISKRVYPVIQPVNPIDGIVYGLELLIDTSHLLIKPQSGQGDYIVGEENANHYDIIDCNKGRIYFAWETDVNGFGKHRTYTLKVVDFSGRPVLQVTRISSCLSCLLRRWFNCFGSTGCLVIVNTPDGMKLGELKQKYNGWNPKFLVRNQYENQIMSIVGPPGGDCCYGFNTMVDAEFPILLPDGNKIGSITKTCLEPMNAKDDNSEDYFGVRFPADLAVEEKATLLGSVFAINVMFFERGLYKPPGPDVVENYGEAKKEERKQIRRQSVQNDLEALGLTGGIRRQSMQDDLDALGLTGIRRQSMQNDLELLGLTGIRRQSMQNDLEEGDHDKYDQQSKADSKSTAKS